MPRIVLCAESVASTLTTTVFTTTLAALQMTSAKNAHPGEWLANIKELNEKREHKVRVLVYNKKNFLKMKGNE